MYQLHVVAFVLLVSISRHVVWGASTKKGVGAHPPGLLCDDFQALNNMTWWYSWSKNLDAYEDRKAELNCTEDFAPPHVPMLFTRWWANIPVLTPGADFVLGFNEPDRADQANLTPQKAAQFWPKVEQLANGLPLVAPVTSGKNMQWLDEFIGNCTGCRFDYVAAHVYTCNVGDTMDYLQTLHNTYNKPVWLTEFACAGTFDVNVQLSYMQRVLPKLEAAPYVFRYAWFSARVREDKYVKRSASLLHADNSSLTALGKFYNNFQQA